eukprot:TRINITY_DN894_c0_g1_i2.p1 TRINITY_DN894_c0_g1~~TRINITY_DN894_c0_g1_i2.p1  ORF type:complete len:437 (-),score=61.31 TRINITY_DN894_c0_g1_i2:1119-2429(-)
MLVEPIQPGRGFHASNKLSSSTGDQLPPSPEDAVEPSAATSGVNDNDGYVPPPEVIGLQPAALVDHMAMVDWSLLDSIPGERGGSMRVTGEELESILAAVRNHTKPPPCSERPVHTLAGGSVGNTVRGLAAGLGVRCGLVGACGTDQGGHMFCRTMKGAGIDLRHLRISEGTTGQCVCMVDKMGNRTMRPCLSDAVRLQANQLRREDFCGAKWVVLNGYAFYAEGLIEHAVALAKAEGARISMDLASFEVVRNFRPRLLALLALGVVDVCFANEDEAIEISRDADGAAASPEKGLALLAKSCDCVVVMLGSRGCIAQRGSEVVQIPAVQVSEAVDTTGAGDLFASGFLFGLMRGLPLADCCRLGCCTGATVVQSLGGEVPPHGWEWFRSQLPLQQLSAVCALLPPTPSTTPDFLTSGKDRAPTAFRGDASPRSIIM